MTESRVNVSHSNFALGVSLFLSTWLVFGRGCENRPSSFEHWLNAKYQYRAADANWQPGGNEQPEQPELDANEQVRAFELIDGNLVEKPSANVTLDGNDTE